MKKFLSLLLVAVMVFGVIGLVGCKGGQNETTTTTTTTQGAQTTTTTTKETTTTVGTTTTTTTTATTPKETTTTTTTTTATTPKETTTPTTTTTEPIATTTLPAFVRFDFGKDTRAADEGLTSHDWLVENLTYNKEYLVLEFLDDSWKIWVKKGYDKNAGRYSWMLQFDNLLSLDFEGALQSCWGTWNGYPYSSGNVGRSWQGHHQYMKIRIKNPTENNMISFWWKSVDNYNTAKVASNMYLQGGVGKKTCEPTEEWKTYIYDITLCVVLASNYGRVDRYPKGVQEDINKGRYDKAHVPFTRVIECAASGDYNGSNNWCWTSGQQTSGIQFSFVGATSVNNAASCDSRDNIKKGTWVEVDYVIFGSTPEQLEAWKSKSEAAANA